MKNVEKWIGYSFNRAEYCETGYDKKAVQGFARNLRAYIKKNVEGVEEMDIYTGYYEIGGFIKGKEGIAYISLPDFRSQDRWVNDILIRTAEHMKDYRGGRNQTTTIASLAKDISNMIN